MFFKVVRLEEAENISLYGRDLVLLIEREINDYEYHTTFTASICTKRAKLYRLGTVKIAKSGIIFPLRMVDYLPSEFQELPEGFFSLWQTAEAYTRVLEFEKKFNFGILSGLNDIAFYPELYTRYSGEEVFRESLMLNVSPSLYLRQFRRIAHGEAVLTPYSFFYVINNSNPIVDNCSLSFSVEPESLPPTNVHAIIGSNGTGKTTLIKEMIKSICKKDDRYGTFKYRNGYFENVICISLNPFDDYSEVECCSKNFKYIGIRKEYNSEGYEDGHSEINLLDDIQNEYMVSLKNCLIDVTKKDDLRIILRMLETEYNFLSSHYTFSLNIDDLSPDEKDMRRAEAFFKHLSAGHKVVLSVITRCIDDLVEKSIVFIDEPENHLHPPLLSALIRSISKMLIKRNGVAIISTHSPIVLQEIPKSCVWIINRVGDTVNARRPELETFGSNLGVLTNEIFGYEVNKTGFSTLLRSAVDKYNNYDRVIKEFHNQLGDEAKSIIRIMLKQKETR